MRKLLALALGAALAPTAALAQVPGLTGVSAVPSPGVITGIQNQQQTYTAGFIGLVAAASATDLTCLAGSASKTIAVTRVQLSGTAGTLISIPVTMVRRTTADSGGTAAGTTANPANNISKHDTNNATAAAVPIAYTANPTINDSSPTYLRSANLTLPVTSAGTSIAPLDWRWGDMATGEQPIILRGAAAQVCLNLNATSPSSSVITGSWTWYEF